MRKFIRFGETMVRYIAEYEADYQPEGHHIKDIAGAKSNVAVNIHKLIPNTVNSIWISRLVDDATGELIQNELQKRISVQAHRFAGKFTGTAYLNHCGDDHIKTYKRQGSAASTLSFADIEPHLPIGDILHITGITPALSKTCQVTTYKALKWAKK